MNTIIKPDKYSFMSDEDYINYYNDCLESHGLTPITLDKVLELIQEDMRIRGVDKEEHQIGKYKTLVCL